MRLQQLGRYQLMDRIAFGGMAEIYRARFIDETGQEQIAAVKKVLSHLSEDDEFIQMLVDEARISSLLHHTNIAKVYEFGREETNYFIAMEFVDGKDLRTILENRRAEGSPLPIQHALYITICVLRGLYEAHTKKGDDGLPLRIIHRDISPSNILITYPGEVKLIDFGIAKAVMNRVRTQTGVIKGKVKYMSPEQAMGQELDARSDLFSVGTVLYEMLTNQPPFLAASELDLIFKVRDANVSPPSRQNPNVDRELDAIMLKAMSRTRQGRFQHGEEFAQTLEEYLLRRFSTYYPQELSDLLQKTFAAQINEERRLFEEELRQARSAPGAAQAAIAKSTGIAKSGAYPSSNKAPSGTSPTAVRPNPPESLRQSTNPLRPSSSENAKPNPFRPPSSEGIPRFGSGANPALRQSMSGANPLMRPLTESRANTPTPAKGSMPIGNPSGVRLGSSANPVVPAALPAPNRALRTTAPKIPVLGDDARLEDEGRGATILSPPVTDEDYPFEINAETINRSADSLPLDDSDEGDESESLDTVRMEPLFDPSAMAQPRNEDPSRSGLEALLHNLDLDDEEKDGKPTRVLYKQEEPRRRTEKKTILARPLRDLLPSPKKPSGDSK